VWVCVCVCVHVWAPIYYYYCMCGHHLLRAVLMLLECMHEESSILLLTLVLVGDSPGWRMNKPSTSVFKQVAGGCSPSWRPFNRAFM